MTIYDVKLFGANYQNKLGISETIMSDNLEDILNKGVLKEFVFEATVLDRFEGKRDVLKIMYEDGSAKYESLYDEGYCYSDGVWKTTIIREYANAFFKAYSKLRETKQKSIFDITFYLTSEADAWIMAFAMAIGSWKLNKEEFPATARVLRRFAGRDFVVEVKIQEEMIYYIPIFSPKERFNIKSKKWVETSCASKIPQKIWECYLNLSK